MPKHPQWCRCAIRPNSTSRFRRAGSAATSLVLAELRRQFGARWRRAIAATAAEPTFYGSSELVLSVDGYGVLEQLSQLDAVGWLERATRAAREGSLSTDLGLLWTQLFLEHRRWRFSSPHEPSPAELAYLDRLPAAVHRALRDEIGETSD